MNYKAWHYVSCVTENPGLQSESPFCHLLALRDGEVTACLIFVPAPSKIKKPQHAKPFRVALSVEVELVGEAQPRLGASTVFLRNPKGSAGHLGSLHSSDVDSSPPEGRALRACFRVRDRYGTPFCKRHSSFPLSPQPASAFSSRDFQSLPEPPIRAGAERQADVLT